MVDIKKLLPIGSIVLLKGGAKKLMIDGLCLVSDGKTYDYGGVLYPEGRLDNQLYMFDHADVDRVIFRGFEDREWVEHLAKLQEWTREEQMHHAKGLHFWKRMR